MLYNLGSNPTHCMAPWVPNRGDPSTESGLVLTVPEHWWGGSPCPINSIKNKINFFFNLWLGKWLNDRITVLDWEALSLVPSAHKHTCHPHFPQWPFEVEAQCGDSYLSNHSPWVTSKLKPSPFRSLIAVWADGNLNVSDSSEFRHWLWLC